MRRSNPTNNPRTRVADRPGQPLAIDRIVGYTPDGTPITAADRFLEIIALGESLTAAAIAANISPRTVADTLQMGSALHHFIVNNRRDETLLTPSEAAKLAFSRRFDVAHSEGATRHIVLRNSVMAGGTVLRTKTTTTKKDADGNVIEETEVIREETLGPSEAMIRWHAERAWPQAYGNHLRLDVHVGELPDVFDIPTDVRIESLAEDAARFLADDEQVIDTVIVESDSGE